jgi:hypothetical protein
MAKSKPQLILCILPNMGIDLYAEIKRVGDTIIGVATQCIQSAHMRQPKKQYCANVCLKVNVKLGGMNSSLDRGDIKFVDDEPTIVMGADVSHPPPGKLYIYIYFFIRIIFIYYISCIFFQVIEKVDHHLSLPFVLLWTLRLHVMQRPLELKKVVTK